MQPTRLGLFVYAIALSVANSVQTVQVAVRHDVAQESAICHTLEPSNFLDMSYFAMRTEAQSVMLEQYERL